MRVAYLLGSYPVLSQSFVTVEFQDHIDAGLDVRMISLRPGEPSDDLGSRIHTLGAPGRWSQLATLRGLLVDPVARGILTDRTFRTLRQRISVAQLAVFLRTHQFDVVHAHFGWTGRGAAYLKARGLLEAKLVTTFHGNDLTSHVRVNGPDVYRELFEQGDLFLPVSQRWADRLVELGCPADKVSVHHMGVDVEALRAPEAASGWGGVHILTTGRMVEKKGQADFIRALADLCTRRPELLAHGTIIGDGPLRDGLEAQARRFGLSSRLLKFAGALPHHLSVHALAEADLFVLPSVTAADGDQEGIPVCLMEAMAREVPVVSTIHSGIPELVDHEVSGILVTEGDWQALSRQIERLADDPELRMRFGKAGRAKVERDFGRKRLGEELRGHYAGLVAGTARVSGAASMSA